MSYINNFFSTSVISFQDCSTKVKVQVLTLIAKVESLIQRVWKNIKEIFSQSKNVLSNFSKKVLSCLIVPGSNQKPSLTINRSQEFQKEGDTIAAAPNCSSSLTQDQPIPSSLPSQISSQQVSPEVRNTTLSVLKVSMVVLGLLFVGGFTLLAIKSLLTQPRDLTQDLIEIHRKQQLLTEALEPIFIEGLKNHCDSESLLCFRDYLVTKSWQYPYLEFDFDNPLYRFTRLTSDQCHRLSGAIAYLSNGTQLSPEEIAQKCMNKSDCFFIARKYLISTQLPEKFPYLFYLYDLAKNSLDPATSKLSFESTIYCYS